jgi:nucleoside-diphosphate-sugar epimerase
MGRVALVTGGNGITGSALVDHLAWKTLDMEWEQIVVTSFSPLRIPIQDPRLRFVQLDFSQEPESLIEQMRATCGKVTHAYFASYIHRIQFSELNIANEKLFKNFLTSLLAVAPNLQNVTLETGGEVSHPRLPPSYNHKTDILHSQYYGGYIRVVEVPHREVQARQGPAAENFYYQQEDLLKQQQQGQKWTYNIIRPEGITGHTLKPNGMNWALSFAIYLLVCKELDIEATLPTNQIFYNIAEDATPRTPDSWWMS